MAIANQLGARLREHSFESFAKQRNWALENCQLRHKWVLFMDADEESTPAFAASVMDSLVQAGPGIAGYFCCWKTMLDGRWLRWSDAFPKWQFRVVRLGLASFVDVGHGQKEGNVDGAIGYIREPYLHHAFNKGWHDWVAKHNGYSDLEAVERLKSVVRWSQVLSRHGSERNVALKQIVSRIPGWPLMRFLHCFFFSGGFLDGRGGFNYAVLMSYYEFLIRLKMRELKRMSRKSA